jgi:hypothetical protein
MVPEDRAARLIARLTSSEFNWARGALPLASLQGIDRTNHTHVWAPTNAPIIQALERAGLDDLEAEANWAFINVIKTRYSEIYTTDGKALGGSRFGFSAAAMVEGTIRHLFGIEYDGMEQTVVIKPKVPKALYGKKLRIANIVIPSSPGTRLSLEVLRDVNDARVEVSFEGPLPPGSVTIVLPGSGRTFVTPPIRRYTALATSPSH